jgi:lysophospholipase L1-like esterase
LAVFFGVCSIIAIILVIDCAVYFILDIKIPGHKPERFFQFSPLFGWCHRPNSEGYWYRHRDGTKYYVTTNRHGFADSERNIEKTRPRIALIGDSVTEFWEVEAKYRGQYAIEQLLHDNFEILNFGVRGYGTDQTHILFATTGVQFAPDIVIYTFCVNDINDNSSARSKPYFTIATGEPGGLSLEGYPIEFRPSLDRQGVGSTLRNYSFVYRTLEEAVPRLGYLTRRLVKGTDSNKGAHLPLTSHFELRPYKKIYDSDDHRRMEVTLKIVSLLSDLVRANGMRILVVEGIYSPVLDENRQKELVQIYGDEFDFEKVTRILENHTEENGIAFLSLPRVITERQITVRELMYRSDSVHLNREGILFYSHAVVDKLRSLHWVDDDQL